jgi:hypothetical protein
LCYRLCGAIGSAGFSEAQRQRKNRADMEREKAERLSMLTSAQGLARASASEKPGLPVGNRIPAELPYASGKRRRKRLTCCKRERTKVVEDSI